MTDIVERLLDFHKAFNTLSILAEAAEEIGNLREVNGWQGLEIERLRTALERIAVVNIQGIAVVDIQGMAVSALLNQPKKFE